MAANPNTYGDKSKYSQSYNSKGFARPGRSLGILFLQQILFLRASLPAAGLSKAKLKKLKLLWPLYLNKVFIYGKVEKSAWITHGFQLDFRNYWGGLSTLPCLPPKPRHFHPLSSIEPILPWAKIKLILFNSYLLSSISHETLPPS